MKKRVIIIGMEDEVLKLMLRDKPHLPIIANPDIPQLTQLPKKKRKKQFWKSPKFDFRKRDAF